MDVKVSDEGVTDIQSDDEVGVDADWAAEVEEGVEEVLLLELADLLLFGVADVLVPGVAVALCKVVRVVVLPASVVASDATTVAPGLPVEVLCIPDPGSGPIMLGRPIPCKMA